MHASVKGEKKIACKAQFLFTIVVECAHVMSIEQTSAWILLTLYSNGVSLKKTGQASAPLAPPSPITLALQAIQNQIMQRCAWEQLRSVMYI